MKNTIAKIFILILLVAVLISAAGVLCHAEDENIIPVEAETPQEATETPHTGEENATLFGRLWEYVVTEKEAVIGVVTAALVCIFSNLSKIAASKSAKTIGNTMKTIAESTNNLLTTQDAVTNCMNGMIDGYNGLAEEYKQYGLTENDRSTVSGGVLVTNIAILEMLYTVYTNSKNLPQGVKDIVSLKYAKAMTSLEDNEKLKGIVETVRRSIGATPEEQTNDQ